jgi:hypothetical protein
MCNHSWDYESGDRNWRIRICEWCGMIQLRNQSARHNDAGTNTEGRGWQITRNVDDPLAYSNGFAYKRESSGSIIIYGPKGWFYTIYIVDWDIPMSLFDGDEQ